MHKGKIALLLLATGCTCIANEYTNTSLLSGNLENDILRQTAENEARLAEKTIHGVRKMSPDEGEKFFLDYWTFLDDSQGLLSDRSIVDHDSANANADDQASDEDTSNDYLTYLFHQRPSPFNPSFPWEGNHGSLLEARDFKCPTGTYACSSIGRSDRCCSTGDTCENVKDTGSGDVGCCPNGKKCSDTVGLCPNPWTTCSEALGGGCCIPGYQCVPGGCAFVSVITVTIGTTTTLSTKTYSTVPQTIPKSSVSSVSSVSSQSTSDTATTGNLVPPARPTGLSTSTHTATSRVSICPTGFYACSAVYHGGCCQTGRDCDTTSCPTTRSTTFTSDGVTIVEPVTTGSGDSGDTGKCATGWFSCADTVGGGCCPSGFICGQSCTAGSSKTTIGKEQATAKSGGNKIEGMWNFMLGMIFMGVWWAVLC
ncbi:hypothetical protein N7478_006631 [Penicillium angulare]|uniref:uncharacterized protein n=1 Tax=Penicillium angulare TaxID=116970 RepID=UPI0025419E3C|nr:uncharacterized protein N7478_006631 [Penicillium angulare]KAJ5281259.1 hypothetical protein N7478_006631 [Penicillium angulare]